jgi:hypothetical protein
MAPVVAGIRPLVVGLELVLRIPVDSAGVGLVVRPGIAAKAGEVLVESEPLPPVEVTLLSRNALIAAT